MPLQARKAPGSEGATGGIAATRAGGGTFTGIASSSPVPEYRKDRGCLPARIWTTRTKRPSTTAHPRRAGITTAEAGRRRRSSRNGQTIHTVNRVLAFPRQPTVSSEPWSSALCFSVRILSDKPYRLQGVRKTCQCGTDRGPDAGMPGHSLASQNRKRGKRPACHCRAGEETVRIYHRVRREPVLPSPIRCRTITGRYCREYPEWRAQGPHAGPYH